MEKELPVTILAPMVVGHDDRELWFFVWLSVMWGRLRLWLARSSCTSFENLCVCELVRGFPCCIRTDGNALASGLPLFLGWFEYSTTLTIGC